MTETKVGTSLQLILIRFSCYIFNFKRAQIKDYEMPCLDRFTHFELSRSILKISRRLFEAVKSCPSCFFLSPYLTFTRLSTARLMQA